MTKRTLIHGGWVLTLGARTPNHTEADVLLEDDKVIEVGKGLRARGAEVVDATDSIVMPGFVDTHRHLSRSLLKNLGERVSVSMDHYDPEDVYAATLIGLLGAIEAGITTVVNWADIPTTDSYEEAALQAHRDAGLRTVFVHSGRNGVDGVITRAFSSRDPRHSNFDQISKEWAAARERGMRIHAHVGTRAEDRGAVSEIRDLLADDVTLVHCSYLDSSDFDAISSSKAAVSITPASEMTGGMGSPPIQQLIDRGIRPGLGIDDERVAPGDVFAQMRATISLQHATYFDLKLAGKSGLPNLLKTRDVIRYGTVDGARAAGLVEVTGSIEPGKQADIVVLRADSPNIFPINDPIGAVVWGMDTSNVDWVFVGGRALMRSGFLEADVARARDLANSAQGRVATASGLLVESGSVEPT